MYVDAPYYYRANLSQSFLNEQFYKTNTYSLRPRRNLTPVSNVCDVVLIFFFWAPNGLNELLKERFEFPFNLIG